MEEVAAEAEESGGSAMATEVVNAEFVNEFASAMSILQEANSGSPNAGGGAGFGLSIVCDGNPIFTYGSGAGGGIRQVHRA